MDLVKLINRYPVTAGTCLLAIVVSLLRWSGNSSDILTVNYRVWQGQLWRPLTTTFPHVNAFHLIFNLYWTWLFGTRIETVFGTSRALGLFCFLAAGSSLAEYDFVGQGVGLSGVVYGLFGLLWVLSRRDRRFWGAVDNQTAALFVGWFFLCIYMTYKDILPVANVAHGVGAVLGLLSGWAVAKRYARNPWLCGAGVAAVMGMLALGGTVARPYINYTEFAGVEFAQMGTDALEAGRDERAVRLFHLALDRYGDWRVWFNLGLAYEKLDRWKEAAAAFRTALDLNPKAADAGQQLEFAKRQAAETERGVPAS